MYMPIYVMILSSAPSSLPVLTFMLADAPDDARWMGVRRDSGCSSSSARIPLRAWADKSPKGTHHRHRSHFWWARANASKKPKVDKPLLCFAAWYPDRSSLSMRIIRFIITVHWPLLVSGTVSDKHGAKQGGFAAIKEFKHILNRFREERPWCYVITYDEDNSI